jgi:hypothetical protein
MGTYVSTRPRADGRPPNLEPLLPGNEAKVSPERERAVSSALERGLVTLVMILGVLCGGFVLMGAFAASVARIGAALRIGR